MAAAASSGAGRARCRAGRKTSVRSVLLLSMLLSSLLLPMQALNLAPITRVCRSCKLAFNPLDPSDRCRFHRGRFIGAERSKHYGTGPSPEMRGLSIFWDCCEAETADAPGCSFGKHISYDDDFDQPYLLIRSLE